MLDELDAWADELERRMGRFGRHLLALEIAGFEVLMDPRLFWGPPRILLRRHARTLEVWLDPTDVHVITRGGFSDVEERRALRVVREHVDELTDLWFHFRNEWKRDRLKSLPWAAGVAAVGGGSGGRGRITIDAHGPPEVGCRGRYDATRTQAGPSCPTEAASPAEDRGIGANPAGSGIPRLGFRSRVCLRRSTSSRPNGMDPVLS